MRGVPRCKCGLKMRKGALPWDIWGNSIFECGHCGRAMKKVPYGDPDKKTYILFILLSLFFTKKLWIERARRGSRIGNRTRVDATI